MVQCSVVTQDIPSPADSYPSDGCGGCWVYKVRFQILLFSTKAASHAKVDVLLKYDV
jgi:hypothetical protein